MLEMGKMAIFVFFPSGSKPSHWVAVLPQTYDVFGSCNKSWSRKATRVSPSGREEKSLCRLGPSSSYSPWCESTRGRCEELKCERLQLQTSHSQHFQLTWKAGTNGSWLRYPAARIRLAFVTEDYSLFPYLILCIFVHSYEPCRSFLCNQLYFWTRVHPIL